MSSYRSFRHALACGAALGAISLYSAAFAQETTEEEDTPVVTIDEVPEEQESRQERVVVTGSLLQRDEFSSSSPIQVITAEVSTLEGLVDTADILQGSSLAAGSTQLNNQFGGFVVEGGVGVQGVDLRGCGTTRTLILINGQRVGPSGTRGQVGQVDLNTIPSSIISRVDILKDGASTTYGSDAVCGVVNIITDANIEEPEITITGSVPFDGGGEEYQIDGAFGFDVGPFDFSVAAQYDFAASLETGDRDYLSCTTDYVRDPDGGGRQDRLNFSAGASSPFDYCNNLYHNTVIDALFGTRYVPSPDGRTIGPINGYRPRENGVDPLTGRSFFEDVLDAPFLDSEHAINENERASVYAVADADFGAVNWKTDFLYSNRQTTSEGWRQFFPLIGSADNPLGATYVYANDPDYTNGFASIVQPVIPYPSNTEVEVDFYNLTSTLSGDFGFTGGYFSDWSWSLAGTYSRSEGEYRNNVIVASRSGDVTFDDNAPTYAPFSPDVLSGAAMASVVAAIGDNTVGETVYEQKVITGIVSGDLFAVPAGDVAIALGAEYREFSIDDTPDDLSRSGDLWGQSSALVTQGENNVSEIFAELDIPLLAGAPFAEEVTLNLAGRVFEYDLGGEGDIYKVGLNWQVTPAVRARGTVGTSYRAPGLYELYLGNQTAFLAQTNIDPCVNYQDSNNPNVIANCSSLGIPADYAGGASSATVVSGGGAGVLDSETSEAMTVGLIYTPTWADFNLALDYFEIEIEDQIGRLGGAGILGGCYGSPNFPNAFCDRFDRNAADNPTAPFAITEVRDSFLNIDKQTQRGLDLTTRYENDLNFGTIIFENQVTWSFEDLFQLFSPDQASGFDNDDFNGTVGNPSVVANGRVSLERGDWTYSWFYDYIGRVDNNRNFVDDLNLPSAYFGQDVLYKVYGEAMWYHDLSVRWQGDTWSVTGAITNVFDEHPPAVSDLLTVRGQSPINGTQYDLRGRTGFLRVSKTF